tara:strand:- start:99 stop:314 length:216 start_codon:yes stop_codon:yes gene_type:complete
MIEIFKGFILFLFVDGTPIEYTPKESLSDCLKTKREIARNIGEAGRYACAQGEVKLKEINGVKLPVGLVED